MPYTSDNTYTTPATRPAPTRPCKARGCHRKCSEQYDFCYRCHQSLPHELREELSRRRWALKNADNTGIYAMRRDALARAVQSARTWLEGQR